MPVVLLFGCTDTAVQSMNALPEVGITSHSNGDAVAEGTEFLLRGIVSDADNDQSELVSTWFSSNETLCDGVLVSDTGVTECAAILPAGETRITLQVTDPDGGSGAANVDIVVTPAGTPIVTISSPEKGGAYYADHLVLFEGTVSITEGLEDPTVWWTSNVDGDIALVLEESDGMYVGQGTLTEGVHELTMHANSAGKVGSAVVSVDVATTSTPPICQIDTPELNSTVGVGSPVQFSGTVFDVDLPAEQLSVVWTSDQDGVLSETPSSPDGMLSFTAKLNAAGLHQITLSVTDEVGESCLATTSVTVAQVPVVVISGPADGTVLNPIDTLTAVATVSDIDQSADTLLLEWRSDIDGVLSTDGANAAGVALLIEDSLSLGTHTITLVATDDFGFSGEDSVVVRINTVPTAPTVSIVPSPASTEDSLTANVDVDGVDADGDPISYTASWYRDGKLVASETSFVVSSALTTSGESWEVHLTAGDGYGEGGVGMASVVIANTPPVLAAVSLTPDPSFEPDILTCTPGSVVDPDGLGAVTYDTNWVVDGALLAATSTTLDGTYFNRDQAVSCVVTPNDGMDDGAAVTSNTVVISNSVPQVLGLAITPDPASVTDEIRCTYTDFIDADGDTDLTNIGWYVNGVAVGSGETLSAAVSLAVGDVVECIATPSDGTDVGVEVSASVTLDNVPPEVSDVVVAPDPVYVGDALRCTYGSITDVDSSPPFSKDYTWLVNGKDVGVNAAALDGVYWSHFDVVACAVTPYDGAAYGDTVFSADVTVSNSAPTMGSVIMTPANPYAGDELSCTSSWFNDADMDPDQSTTVWSVNGVVTATSATLNSGFVYGDSVTCEMTAFDGFDAGTINSATKTILNTAPTVLSVSVTPDPAYDALLTCVASGVDDPDGQAVTYTGRWNVNGKTASGGDTLSAFYMEKGDTVYCEMRANDGVVSGDFLSSPSVVIQNSPPDLNMAWITPLAPDPSDTLTCNTNGFSDADGDTDQTIFSWEVDGVVVGTGQTLAGAFGFNDEVTCTATAFDGEDYGTELVATVSIENSLPTVMGVNINPKPVGTNDVLEVTGTVSDDDGDTVTLVYSWTVDGVEVSTDATLDGAIHFDKGQLVEVTVTPFDGFEYGISKTDDVEVQNSLPEGLTVLINPQTPYGGIDDLVCEVDTPPIDADGDAVTYSVWWKKNDSAWGGAPETTFWADDTVTSNRTSEGDTWKCIMTPNDGEDDGYSNNNEVTVLDPCLVSVCDTGPTGDTGPVGFYDGTWEGIFFGDFWVTTLGLTDTCDVPLDVVIEEGGAPEIRGSTSCTLNYTFFGVDFTDTKGIIFSANITADPVIEGEVTVDTAVEPWTGSFTDDDTLYGDFSGATEVYGYTVEYSGSISATR